MENTAATELAQEVLRRCLEYESWQCPEFDQLISQAIASESAREASRALFSVLVEGLADRFERRLCDAYAELFCEAVGRVLPELWPAELLERYQRIRYAHPFIGDPSLIQHVFVLSRVTLGADVVVTSTIMSGLKRCFPQAELHFVGPRKNFELFAQDPRVRHVPVEYRRGGTLSDRLAVWPELQMLLQAPNSIVIDPDSRYTQLGLLPVCARDEQYFFFESRTYGEQSDETLAALTRRWVESCFHVPDAAPYLAVEAAIGPASEISVSLGVGENENKRLPDPFEADLLQLLGSDTSRLCVDSGTGADEGSRVARALANLPKRQVQRWSGTFASFAAQIQRTDLYVGYDSAGQHVAAALEVPLISVFAGEVCERMYQRWRPSGNGSIEVVRSRDPRQAIHDVELALQRLQR